MNQKKKKPTEAQQLIDSLLDEKTPSPEGGAKRVGASAPPPGVKSLDASDDSDASESSGEFVFHDEIDPKASDDETRFGFNGTPRVISLTDEESGESLRLEGEHSFGGKHKPAKSNEPKVAVPQRQEQVKTPHKTPQMSSDDELDDRTRVLAPVKQQAKVLANAPNKNAEPRPQSMMANSESRTEQKPPVAGKSSSPSSEEPERDEDASIDRWLPTEVKGEPRGRQSSDAEVNVAQPGNRVASSAFTSAEAALKQSENLRIAQGRISELEHELERLRRENEKLATAGETLRRRTDELLSKAESLESQEREAIRIFNEEKKVLRGQMQQKERENIDMRGRMEEMEARLESNFKKIRVRERELEHRLEIIKMESATLVSTKDKMILELKRQIDQLVHENDYAKQKSQEHFNQFKEKQETIRRVVRALRIALTILEGDEDAAPLKKAD